MLSIRSEPRSETATIARCEEIPPANFAAPDEMDEAPERDESEEFEIVLGRRQVASVLFVATVFVAVMCAVSYLAGKSILPKRVEAASAVTPVPAPPIENTVENRIETPIVAASVIVPPVETVKPAAPAKVASPPGPVAPPLFSEPKAGATYMQMAAVDKGVAAIFAEGLRARGFSAFVAPGPTETMFRVLIGPLADSAAYARTKAELDQIGVLTFGRRYDK